jgi:hypothetical protein
LIHPTRPLAALAAVLLASSQGCGLAQLQTPRTVPRGETQTTIATGLLHTSDRGVALLGIPLVPVEVMVRHGVTDRVDWGVRNFFGIGVAGDVKWSLLPRERRAAVSLSAGTGLSYDAGVAWRVPVTVAASHRVLPWFTPYAAVGYGAYWIFGYGDGHDPYQSYAPRSWTGDGLLSLHAGVELSRASGRALMLEYTHARPIVRDPGDFYEFAVSNLISIGFHTGPALTR